jgi:hypothetical protein
VLLPLVIEFIILRPLRSIPAMIGLADESAAAQRGPRHE